MLAHNHLAASGVAGSDGHCSGTVVLWAVGVLGWATGAEVAMGNESSIVQRVRGGGGSGGGVGSGDRYRVSADDGFSTEVRAAAGWQLAPWTSESIPARCLESKACNLNCYVCFAWSDIHHHCGTTTPPAPQPRETARSSGGHTAGSGWGRISIIVIMLQCDRDVGLDTTFGQCAPAATSTCCHIRVELVA